jgi:two-component system cell cycle sensor histidine kinase/response regulator CckA
MCAAEARVLAAQASADPGLNGGRAVALLKTGVLERAIFDSANFSCIATDASGVIQLFNVGAERMLGYRAAEVIDKITPADISDPQELVARATALTAELGTHIAPGFEALAFKASHGLEDIYELAYFRKDGSRFSAVVSVTALRDVEERIIGYLLIGTDNTARKQAEEERQKLQRYRTLLESASDAIAVLTPEGVVLEMNQRWASIVDLPREQLIGRHLREFASRGGEESLTGNHPPIEPGGALANTVEVATPDGSHVLLQFSNTTIDVGGEQLVLTIGRDVTEQRQLEKQLRQAQKLEVIGQLAGGVAHDFNNLLTAILGFSEMLLNDMDPDDPKCADVLEIKKAGERAAGLTRQLSAFSRKQVLQPVVLELNGFVAGIEPMLRRLIAAHIDLSVSLQPDIGAVKIDPTQLEQIIINLAVNAADAMPAGGKLAIKTANVRLDADHRRHHLPIGPGEYVMLAVSDTGVGMDDATSQHIFEPFFTTKEVGKGTGLGLATVYGIVKQSGGDIWVDSQPGHGSAFKIYLPRVTTASAPTAVVAAAVLDSLPRGIETILLVEDDPAVRRLARLGLERSGYRVLEAENPKLALRLANQLDEPIDLLLSDVIMPESEGTPLFQRLLTTRPGLRVLYFSGYAADAIIRRHIAVDGAPFLQKPFTPLALLGKVRSVLDAPGPARPRPPEAVGSPVSTCAPPGPITRVLLVDDEADVVRSLARVLTQAGCEVTTTSEGSEAIALSASAKFDVIVSDIRMPHVDGLTLLRAIRGRDLDVPVVFMTGVPTVETAVEAMEHGAFRYLIKPVEPARLVEVVERAAQIHRLAQVRREVAGEIPGKPIGDRAGLESRYALAVDKLWLAAQPILSWRDRTVYAYESLLRTDEPSLGSPIDFIEAAERLGHVAELGRTIRRRIATQIAEAPAATQIFVNLHPADLVDDELCSVQGALTPFATRVVLEVTERAALEQIPGLNVAMIRLRKLGYRFALDDLGAGYAGSARFALLEPEIVKVDMSLVRGIHDSPVKQKLFQSFATLCRDINTEIIAEGVEAPEERDCLSELGGDLFQGNLFAHPDRGFPAPVY